MLIAAVMMAAASPSAVALGEQLARSGTMAALLPMIAEKETGELVAAHPELTPAEVAALRRTAAATYERGTARLFAVQGRTYAELLTEAELRVLVAQAESPAARRLRAVQPRVISTTMGAMQGLDFKKDVMAAFCAETGKGCAAR